MRGDMRHSVHEIRTVFLDRQLAVRGKEFRRDCNTIGFNPRCRADWNREPRIALADDLSTLGDSAQRSEGANPATAIQSVGDQDRNRWVRISCGEVGQRLPMEGSGDCDCSLPESRRRTRHGARTLAHARSRLLGHLPKIGQAKKRHAGSDPLEARLWITSGWPTNRSQPSQMQCSAAFILTVTSLAAQNH